MKIPEINCILSDREIADMVDGIYKQNHEYYTIDENGFILGYKDQKRLAEKEYLTELLCKWRNINRWLNNGASPYERVTLAMIEEKEKERDTLYRQIENALNGKFVINNNEENLPNVLNTDKAKAILQKVIAAELCNSNYKWNGTIQLLSYFADRMSRYLKLTNKMDKDGNIQTSWKPFETLFGYEGKVQGIDKLKGAKQNWMKNNTKFEPTGHEKVDALFE